MSFGMGMMRGELTLGKCGTIEPGEGWACM